VKPSAVLLPGLIWLLLLGCENSVSTPNLNEELFKPGEVRPPTPQLDKIPSPYPYSTVAVRGTAPGRAAGVIVYLAGLEKNYSTDVNPADQSFCIDIPFPQTPALYRFAVQAQGVDGNLSENTVSVSVTYNPKADPASVGRVARCDGTIPSLQ